MAVQDVERIKRLEQAITRLSENVTGLATSLAMVGEINEKQAELESKAQDSENQIVTLKEANRRSYIGVAIMGIVFLLLLSYVRYESITQIAGRLEANHSLCTAANAHIEYEVRLIRSSPNPDRRMIENAVKGLKDLQRDCDKLFGPQNRPVFFQPFGH